MYNDESRSLGTRQKCRHSGRDCRNPEAMDGNQSARYLRQVNSRPTDSPPCGLDSGNPCRNKVISNNETTKTKMNYPQNHEQSPRQAGAWRSQKERQAPAWPLDGMFFIGYHLKALINLCQNENCCRLTVLVTSSTE